MDELFILTVLIINKILAAKYQSKTSTTQKNNRIKKN